MSDSKGKKENGPLNKRAIVVVALPIVAVAVFLVLFFVVFNGNDNNDNESTPNINSDVVISESEQVELESTAERIVNQTGNFGVKKDVVTSENIDELATLLEIDVNSADYYFTSRATAYNTIDEYTMEGSPIDYNQTEVNSWSNDFETLFRNSFSIESVEASAYDEGTFVDLNGNQLRAATVRVSFNSNETMFVEVGSEFGAERSYSVRSKNFNNTTANFIFVIDADNEWKLYDIRDLNNEFLLATWNNPRSDAFSETQFDLQEVDTITPPNQESETP